LKLLRLLEIKFWIEVPMFFLKGRHLARRLVVKMAMLMKTSLSSVRFMFFLAFPSLARPMPLPLILQQGLSSILRVCFLLV